MSFRPKRNRGTTLIELLVVITIQVVVIGSATGLLCFTLAQVGQNSAGMASLQQASKVLGDISDTVREAVSCSVVSTNGHQGLRCLMPGNASDSDADGVNDVFTPSSFSSSDAKPVYSAGKYIWYYMASSSGNFGSSEKYIWRAVRADSNDPSGSDADRKWSLYYAGESRYPLVETIDFTADSTNQVVKVKLTASAADYAPERSGAGTTSTDLQSVTFSETLPWRSDFE